MAGVLLKVCMRTCVRDVCICARAHACAGGGAILCTCVCVRDVCLRARDIS